MMGLAELEDLSNMLEDLEMEGEDTSAAPKLVSDPDRFILPTSSNASFNSLVLSLASEMSEMFISTEFCSVQDLMFVQVIYWRLINKTMF